MYRSPSPGQREIIFQQPQYQMNPQYQQYPQNIKYPHEHKHRYNPYVPDQKIYPQQPIQYKRTQERSLSQSNERSESLARVPYYPQKVVYYYPEPLQNDYKKHAKKAKQYPATAEKVVREPQVYPEQRRHRQISPQEDAYYIQQQRIQQNRQPQGYKQYVQPGQYLPAQYFGLNESQLQKQGYLVPRMALSKQNSINDSDSIQSEQNDKNYNKRAPQKQQTANYYMPPLYQEEQQKQKFHKHEKLIEPKTKQIQSQIIQAPNGDHLQSMVHEYKQMKIDEAYHQQRHMVQPGRSPQERIVYYQAPQPHDLPPQIPYQASPRQVKQEQIQQAQPAYYLAYPNIKQQEYQAQQIEGQQYIPPQPQLPEYSQYPPQDEAKQAPKYVFQPTQSDYIRYQKQQYAQQQYAQQSQYPQQIQSQVEPHKQQQQQQRYFSEEQKQHAHQHQHMQPPLNMPQQQQPPINVPQQQQPLNMPQQQQPLNMPQQQQPLNVPQQLTPLNAPQQQQPLNVPQQQQPLPQQQQPLPQQQQPPLNVPQQQQPVNVPQQQQPSRISQNNLITIERASFQEMIQRLENYGIYVQKLTEENYKMKIQIQELKNQLIPQNYSLELVALKHELTQKNYAIQEMEQIISTLKQNTDIEKQISEQFNENGNKKQQKTNKKLTELQKKQQRAQQQLKESSQLIQKHSQQFQQKKQELLLQQQELADSLRIKLEEHKSKDHPASGQQSPVKAYEMEDLKKQQFQAFQLHEEKFRQQILSKKKKNEDEGEDEENEAKSQN